MQDSRTVTRSQIPILGDIPLIGNAVGNKDNAIVKTELIILIRPHVIRNLDEARQITDEYRQYMGVEGPHRRSQSSTIEDTGRRILN
jgi:general secretion pathway protein D